MQYFETDYPDFAQFNKRLPPWLAPQGADVVREMWEGSDRLPFSPSPGDLTLSRSVADGARNLVCSTARVPWAAWYRPVLVVGVLVVAMATSFVCLVCLFRAKWEDEEHLGFPLVSLPLLITESAAQGRPAFFKDPLMWAGLLAGVAFNVAHVASAVNPSLPQVNRSLSIGALFTERPWSAVGDVRAWMAPDLLGIGYLVPQEVLLTTAVTHLAMRLLTVSAEAAGRNTIGFPYDFIQGNGAYIAMVGVVVWMSRRHLALMTQRAVRGEPPAPGDPMRPRTMVVGGALGYALVCGIAVAAGMPPWLAITYMGLIWAIALVLARARAEGGAPVVYMFPYEQARRIITTVVPIGVLTPGASTVPVAAMNLMFFLSAGQFSAVMPGEMEAVRLARVGGFSRHRVVWMGLCAIALGYVVSMWMHLATYYDFGANVLEGGDIQGGYRTSATLLEFGQATRLALHGADAVALHRERLASLAGGVTVVAIMVGRLRISRFPFHPIGFLVGLYRGQFCWAPFLFTYTVRAAALHIGGVRLGRRLLPAFVGFALGHFLANGLIIGLAGIWIGHLFAGRVQHVRSH